MKWQNRRAKTEFEDKHDMRSHTLEDVETVSDDEESEEKDDLAYNELIDAIWKEHNPLFQRNATELMEEDDISEEEARSVAMHSLQIQDMGVHSQH